MTTPREKMNALKARTLANGCTPSEVVAANVLAAVLLLDDEEDS